MFVRRIATSLVLVLLSLAVNGLAYAAPPDGAATSKQLLPTNNPEIFAFPTPPKGFDPRGASDEDLAAFGIPPRPPIIDKERYQRWVDMVGSIRTYVTPSFGTPTNIQFNNVAPNWSGTAVRASGKPFNMVWGAWVVPYVDQSDPFQMSYSSEWVGLDGVDNKQVEQMGTIQVSDKLFGDCKAIPCTYNYFAWVELFPDDIAPITSVPVNAWDTMYAFIWFNGELAPGRLYFYLANKTASVGTAFTLAATHGVPGMSAEWIEERPTVNGHLPPLANFGSVTLTSMGFETADGANYAANQNPFGPFRIDMYDGSQQLDYTVATGATQDVITWERSN
ncbi:MAG: hypothetical protein JO352_09495 [Chloroflexi bacterium]|nr:hypothetical protein [Chloroflexota bacterium]MBV9596537.1 hypothetical protein [Chloroflexota bacterium]